MPKPSPRRTRKNRPTRVEQIAQQDAFLEAYEAIATISGAAKQCGIDRGTHYGWLTADPDYAIRFARSDETAVERLEQEARRRAMVGTDEPVYYKGDVVGRVRKYSDVLLIFLLKAARPTKYRDNIAISHKVDYSRLTDDEITTLERLRRKLGA